MSKPLTTDQLRREVIKEIAFLLGSTDIHPDSLAMQQVDAIMTAVKDHVEYVIGEDLPAIVAANDRAAEAVNITKRAQRETLEQLRKDLS
jgi:uncharacterized protein (DUF2342 family)